MTLATCLRSLKTRLDGNQPRRKSRRPPSHKPATAKPRLEPLEERQLLSGFGPADGAYIVEAWNGAYNDVQIQPGDQKIVAAGDMSSNMAIARYDSLGNPDNTYGTGGPSIPPLSGVSAPALGSSNAYADDLALQPDGRAVVAGNASEGTYSAFAVARFNIDGTLDSGFGGGGWTSLDARAGDFNPAEGVGLQSTGKVVVAGLSIASGSSTAELARFTAGGAIDSGKGAFGDVVQGKAVGYTLTTFGMPLNAFSDLAVQPDDKLVAVGMTTPNSPNSHSLIVARYTASGTLDKTFNGKGYSVFLPAGISDAFAGGVTLQSNGKIVVTGSCTGTDGANDMLVARFNTNGTLDTSFGGGSGYVRLDNAAAPQSQEVGHDVVIQPDGKIVVGGWTSVTGNPSNQADVMVARFNVDGTPDSTFATGGYKIGAPLPNTGYHSFEGTGVALQSDGSIIVAGDDDQGTNGDYPLLMRFFPTSSSSPTAASRAALAPSYAESLAGAKVQPPPTPGIARWAATEVNVTALGSLDVRSTNVPDVTLGLASGNTIIVDSSTAGSGWFVGRSWRRGRVPQGGRTDQLSALITSEV